MGGARARHRHGAFGFYRLLRRIALLAGLVPWLAACSNPELRPFRSDGCSLFPDRSPNGQVDWCDCCLEHDLAYWRGGTAAERETADRRLRDCVLNKTGSAALASAMYVGVRAGGGSYFPTWYRWGYGWNYTFGYRKLTPDESALADRLEGEYKQARPGPVCRP
jgi:hypothetical protein